MTPDVPHCRRHVAAVLVAAGAVWWVVTLPGAAQTRGAIEDLTEYLPPGQGRPLAARLCTGCHDLRGTLRLRQGRTAWEALVLDMGARGAPLALDEVDPLIEYDPPDRLTKIPGVTPAAAQALVAARARGPLTTAEQVRETLSLDAAAFERVRYFLYVKKPDPM
jgi:hypothetical protein